jgi:soluble lytic murein transglycosylase
MRRYERNRVKSLAAYNAGPSRVSRWSSGELPLDQWVDSLPFGETREYVQAVLGLHCYLSHSKWGDRFVAIRF